MAERRPTDGRKKKVVIPWFEADERPNRGRTEAEETFAYQSLIYRFQIPDRRPILSQIRTTLDFQLTIPLFSSPDEAYMLRKIINFVVCDKEQEPAAKL